MRRPDLILYGVPCCLAFHASLQAWPVLVAGPVRQMISRQ